MTDEPFGPDHLPDAVDGLGVEPPDTAVAPRRRKESIGQTIGGVLFGFEQQVLRTMPPPHELVHHARPDAPIPAGDGSLIHIGMPDLAMRGEAEPDGEAEPAAASDAGTEPAAGAGADPEGDA